MTDVKTLTFPEAAKKAAKKYSRQFADGREFGSLSDYALTDFVAGVKWAMENRDD